MALFDLFTGAPAKEAAAANRAQLTSAQGTIGNIADATKQYNEDALRQGYGAARTDLGTGYGASTGAINAGAGNAINYLDAGNAGALTYYDKARAGLTADGGAFKPLTDLATKFGGGANLYGDALGINGAAGNDRARAAFTEAPGYQATITSAVDLLNRRRNAAGSLNSGNADAEAVKLGTDAANGQWQQWLTNLSPYNTLQLSATQGAAAGNQANNQAVAGIDTGAGNIVNQGGVAKAGVAQGQGNSLADIAQRYYTGLGNLDTGEGTALAGNQTNASNMVANSLLGLAPKIGQTYSDEAQAGLTGQKNLLNLIMQGATAAAGSPSLAGLGSGFGSATAGTFGGNLGASGILDPSMWNKSLPAGSFTGV